MKLSNSCSCCLALCKGHYRRVRKWMQHIVSGSKMDAEGGIKQSRKRVSSKIQSWPLSGFSLEKVNNKVEPTTQIKPRRKERSLGIRVKPCITDRERERMLQKIATKGVIQLFNAVRQQQTEISKKLSEAGPLERKREQVMKNINKNAFLDILMGKSESVPVDDTAESEKMVKSIGNRDKDDKIWGVLRDDFGMGAKLKDWDKKDTEEEDSSTPNDMDSDD